MNGYMFGKRSVAFLVLVLVPGQFLVGQIDTRIPPKAEHEEAQSLGSDFFNQYEKTQDLAPLIATFFIRDFTSRLKYCGMTGKCGGFARDFWQENDELSSLNGTKEDYARLYINSINSMTLGFRSMAYLAMLSNKKPSDYEEAGWNELKKRVAKRLRIRPQALKLGFFEESDVALVKAKTLREFRHRLVGSENVNAALRVVERHLRLELLRKRPATRLSVRPSEFRVYKEANKEGFFHFPVDVPMYNVWTDNDFIILKVDMVREDGKLKIVAVYPPID